MSRVIELGSNDGYLLQFFVQRVFRLEIDPAANVARAAEARGVPTLVKFFGVETARELAEKNIQGDLVLGNNVLAQVTNINSFVEGVRIILKPHGVCTIEFPHLLKTIADNQFDQIYHEHFCTSQHLPPREFLLLTACAYSTLRNCGRMAARCGSMRAMPAIEPPHVTCGFGNYAPRARRWPGQARGLYQFAERVRATSERKLLSFLIKAKSSGNRSPCDGAPGKSSTLLNYCGTRNLNSLDYTVDRNPYKHGKAPAGDPHLNFPPEKIAETKPDYILILPWNLKDEVMSQLTQTPATGAPGLLYPQFRNCQSYRSSRLVSHFASGTVNVGQLRPVSCARCSTSGFGAIGPRTV